MLKPHIHIYIHVYIYVIGKVVQYGLWSNPSGIGGDYYNTQAAWKSLTSMDVTHPLFAVHATFRRIACTQIPMTLPYLRSETHAFFSFISWSVFSATRNMNLLIFDINFDI